MRDKTLIGLLVAGFILVQPTWATGQGKKLSDRAKAMDANKDGLIQKNEAKGPLLSNFKVMDCDKNKGLDGAEISGFFTGAECPKSAALPKKPKNQVVLNFASPSPARAPINWSFLRPWTKKVNADGGGSIKISLKTGRTLATALNVYGRVLSNVAQIGWGGQLLFGGKFQHSLVTGLPFLIRNSEEGSLALWRLYEKGIIKSEYDEVRPLALTTFPILGFHTKKRPIKSLGDLKGLKLRSTSRLSAKVIKFLGAAPISIPFYDQYQAINRGTIDGTLAQWTIFSPFKLDEVTKYHIEGLQMGAFPGTVFITHKIYDSLPANARKAINANSGEKFSHNFGKFWDKAQSEGRAYVEKKPGHTITTISSGEEAKWRKKMKPITTQWIKSMPNGQKILDALKAELEIIRSKK